MHNTPLSFREVKRKLEKLGFNIVSQKGSHIKFAKRIDNDTITTIVPNHKEIPVGTLKSIIKQAFLGDQDFYSA